MKRKLRVGIFVLVSLILMGIAVFLIGDSKKFWEKHVAYKAAFRDVSGLKPGAPVRLGGLDVGTVVTVGHKPTTTDDLVYVELSILRAEAGRVRKDTRAKVANKGLLGDKMIELSLTDESSPLQDPNELMQVEEPKDMFASADAIATKAQKLMERIEPLATTLGDAKLQQDIKGTASSINQILDAVAHRDSMVHRALYDEEQARKLDQAMTNLTQASRQMNAILADVKDVTTHVRGGPGIAHAVIYDGDMSKNASGALAEVHRDLKAIREGNGLAHAVLYGDDQSQHIMGNMSAMTDDLRQIMAGVRQGKGTIGALLVDPSIYEDLKSAIGNVERNQVLRALVRYSIKQDESKPHVTTPPVEPAASRP